MEEHDLENLDQEKNVSGLEEKIDNLSPNLQSVSVAAICERDVFIRQSEYLLKRGQGEAALDNINRALENTPDCGLLLTTRSLCYLTLEHWQVSRKLINFRVSNLVSESSN